MFEYLRGKVGSVSLPSADEAHIVLDVYGHAYKILVTPAFSAKHRDNPVVTIGDAGTTLLIHHKKTDTTDQLFGFESEDERYLFRDLMDADGVGPKTALRVLSLGSVANIRQSIRMQSVPFLKRAVGEKTAQKIILAFAKK